MPIRFLCFNCAAKIKVPDGTHGRKVKCPSCNSMQRVPEESIVQPAPAPAEPAVETSSHIQDETPAVDPPAPVAQDAPAEMPPQYEEEPAADDPLAALAAAADGDAPMADMPTEEILSQLSADDQAPSDNELARAAAAMNQGSSDEESPALPWTSVDQESESDDSQSSDAQDDSASQEQPQPAARPAAPESAAQPDEAAAPESKPPQPEASSDDASEHRRSGRRRCSRQRRRGQYDSAQASTCPCCAQSDSAGAWQFLPFHDGPPAACPHARC
jgi:hypothetical protein